MNTKPSPTLSRQRKPTAEPLKADADLNGIIALFGTIHALHRQMAASHAPVVQHLILTRSRDEREIEQTLDRLLDCACIPEGLTLFKALCRYYYKINPASTATYVYAYRDMWDSEEDQAQEVAS